MSDSARTDDWPGDDDTSPVEAIQQCALELDHRFYLVDMTPNLAALILGINHQNRKIKSGRLSTYARDMANGRWRLSPQPIVLSDTTLWDGQHRLRAVIVAKVTIPLIVVITTDELWQDVLQVVDTGASRTLYDVLYMLGVDNASLVASAVKQSLVFTYHDASATLPHPPASWSRSEQMDYWEENKELFAYVAALAKERGARLGISRDKWAGLHARLRLLNPEFADQFMQRLMDVPSEEDGFHSLRAYLLNQEANLRTVKEHQFVQVVAKVWNAWIAGEIATVKLIKYLPDQRVGFNLPPA
jgi:hypothetical protein